MGEYRSNNSFVIWLDTGFIFDRSKSLILTVNYRQEKRMRKEQSGMTLNISTQP